MNHSQTIVSCTMTCALAREHGSEHGSERGTNSPDGRSSGHAYKLPVRIEPVESDGWQPIGAPVLSSVFSAWSAGFWVQHCK